MNAILFARGAIVAVGMQAGKIRTTSKPATMVLAFIYTLSSIDCPTVGVSGVWAEGGLALETEPTPSQTKAQKTRRLPDFRCTLC